MRSVLTTIVKHLEVSQGFVNAMEGGNIWDVNQPPDDTVLPTVTTLWQDAAMRGTPGVRLGLVTFDIWDNQGSTVRCEKIRDELEFYLDRRILTVGEKQWVRMFIGSEAQIPTEVNEPLVHWTLDFTARYWRQAWIERRAVE